MRPLSACVLPKVCVSGSGESESVCICLSAISILGMCMRSGRAPLSQDSSQEVAADFLSLSLVCISSSLDAALPLQGLFIPQMP